MPNVSAGALWTVYLIICMDTLNFGIVFPLLPSIADTFHADATQVGSLATAYSIAQVVCTPLLGQASDRFGRRPVLLISVLGTTLSSVVTGLAKSFPVLLAARVINGASGATAGIANAYIADVTTTEEKPIYLSYLSASNSVGIIIGPAVGGLLSHWGFDIACYVSGGLSLLNLILGVFTLTESNRNRRQDATAALNDSQAQETTPASQQPDPEAPAPRIPKRALLLFAAAFLFTMGFAAFEAITGYFLKDTFFKGNEKVAGQYYGGLFMLAGITMLVNAVFFYKPLIRCVGERMVCVIGMVLRTAGFIGQAESPTVLLFSVSTMVQVAGSNYIMPTTSSMLTQICDKRIYGRALGLSQACGAVARVVSPMVFGYLYDHVNHTFAFYVNAVAGVFGVLLIIMVPRKAVAAEPTEEDCEANVEVFERQPSVPIDRAAMHEAVLVRSNSSAVARTASSMSRSNSARSPCSADWRTPRSPGATSRGFSQVEPAS